MIKLISRILGLSAPKASGPRPDAYNEIAEGLVPRISWGWGYLNREVEQMMGVNLEEDPRILLRYYVAQNGISLRIGQWTDHTLNGWRMKSPAPGWALNIRAKTRKEAVVKLAGALRAYDRERALRDPAFRGINDVLEDLIKEA